ncbi:hypothetical protein TGFOU_364600 [Toxoplasma gondii FOU]|uniref:Transmembrane protein n=2 Tax=Toxoplasma gondii TaxID=5811 RepID=A0A086K8C2_TOXGO|nr:hypothetical protein TGFOU_364600 [Toxoplasma gondii FOU]PUA84462.1 hypothetical protein TGBR9_364600 [Toxoplasma gondii TgCATBr9]
MPVSCMCFLSFSSCSPFSFSLCPSCFFSLCATAFDRLSFIFVKVVRRLSVGVRTLPCTRSCLCRSNRQSTSVFSCVEATPLDASVLVLGSVSLAFYTATKRGERRRIQLRRRHFIGARRGERRRGKREGSGDFEELVDSQKKIPPHAVEQCDVRLCLRMAGCRTATIPPARFLQDAALSRSLDAACRGVFALLPCLLCSGRCVDLSRRGPRGDARRRRSGRRQRGRGTNCRRDTRGRRTLRGQRRGSGR